MKKIYLISLTLLFALITTSGFSQTDKFWSANSEIRSSITTDKAVARPSFPAVFKLFNLNIEPLRRELFTITDNQAKHSTLITLPNADGGLEQFEVFEASNFEPSLQARYPGIRAFSGRGITDKYATVKLSISPQGIQTMVFRTEKANEFIEAYSQDHRVYAVFTSQREKGKMAWTCSTEDQQVYADLSAKIPGSNLTGSSTGELKTMRLAQSCNGEYSNYFGAFNIGQIGLVYAAYNATLTRCNGCYEKDLALHLNLISNTFEDQIIFFDPATDPYTTLGNWNNQLQALLTAVVGDANYDIGHMFGASGGGGNAGCIGCVCVAGIKGRGITSPADNIPMGDNFDIDYVVHEVGHQLGANHTFSHGLEG
ncbi:MAG: reprolysin-like metallopeptidase, partial [Ferruginibacter sp.]